MMGSQSKKGKKTTIVAYSAAAIIVALLVALFIEKITADDFFNGLTSVGAAAVVFIGFLSKDFDQSHTKE